MLKLKLEEKSIKQQLDTLLKLQERICFLNSQARKKR